MNGRVLPLLALAFSLLMAMAVVGFSSGGAKPVSPLDPTPSPTATPAPPEPDAGATPGPVEPPDVAHRPEALAGDCADCHGGEGRWALCEAGARDPSGDCQACHAQAPPAGPVSLHRLPEDETSAPLCAVCHSDIAAAPPQVDVARAEECSACHSDDLADVLPDDHSDRSIVTCMVCHQTEPLAAPPVPHRVEGWERCTFCHGEGRLTVLEGAHEASADDECLGCHEGPAAIAPDAQECMATIANLEAQGCTTCHGQDGPAPQPAGHEQRSYALCGLCHTVDHHSAPQAPHSPPGDRTCTGCHQSDGLAAPTVVLDEAPPTMCAACHARLPGAIPDALHPYHGSSTLADCPQPSGGSPIGLSQHPD
jgi:predicted CXXCH cytochrome family protein